MKKTTRLKKPQVPELDKLYLFDELGGRPKYGDEEMTSETDIPSFDSIMDDTHSAVVAETSARVLADRALQNEIDTIKAASDVVDIVGTYADLQAYDTSKLNDNDIIKVLEDETHDNAVSYYRWAEASSQFSYIGSQGPYQDKLIAGSNIQIASDGKTISATDTTYSNFVGTDGTTAGVAGLVPAPAVTDAGKVLSADGTWVTGGPDVVQTTGSSTTDVMSQKATTAMVHPTYTMGGDEIIQMASVNIGSGNSPANSNNVFITGQREIHKNYSSSQYDVLVAGYVKSQNEQRPKNKWVAIGGTDNNFANDATYATGSVNIGVNATTGFINSIESTDYTQGAIAIGYNSHASARGSIALGYKASLTGTSDIGVMTIGTTDTDYGYNSSNYRLLTGVYDPINAHDAATKGYVDTVVAGAAATINSTDWSALWQ